MEGFKKKTQNVLFLFIDKLFCLSVSKAYEERDDLIDVVLRLNFICKIV